MSSWLDTQLKDQTVEGLRKTAKTILENQNIFGFGGGRARAAAESALSALSDYEKSVGRKNQRGEDLAQRKIERAEELLEKVQEVKVEEPATLDVPPAPEGPDDTPDEEDIVIEIDHISDTTLTDESVMASETLPTPEMPTPLENETVEPTPPDAPEIPPTPLEIPALVESSPSETVE